MLKSTEHDKDNVYRIVKVLTNQDYLVVDQEQQHYILAPYGASPLPRRAQHQSKHQHQLSRIIPVTQSIVMDNMSYSIFKAGVQSMTWTKDIEIKQKLAHRFIENVLRDALTCILESLLWMNPQHALSIIHVNNFWMLDGQLFLLEMPRVYSLPKTENKRSYSHEPTSMTTVIDKEMNIIKRVAECLWEILFHNQLDQLKEDQFQGERLMLTRMMRKQLSYQQIMTNLGQFHLNIGRFTTKKHKYANPLRKELFNRKKHSQPLSLILNTGNKKRNSLQSLESSSISKFSEQRKVFEYKKKSNTLPVPQQTKSLIDFNRILLMQRAKSTEPRQTFSTNLMLNKIPKKMLTTPKKQSFTRQTNEGERSNYLNWIKAHKFNLTTPANPKLHIRDSKRQLTKKQEGSVKEKSMGSNDDDQLKRRLLSKIEKYRNSRYCKSVYTQTVNSQVQVLHSHEVIDKMQDSHFSEQQYRQEQRSLTALNQNTQFSIKKVDSNKKQGNADYLSLLEDSSQKVHPQSFKEPVTKKLSYEIFSGGKGQSEFNNNDKKGSSVVDGEPLSKQSFWQKNISIVQHQAIEEAVFTPQQDKQILKDSLSLQYTEPRRADPKNNEILPTTKQNKNIKAQMIADDADLEDIEIISFGPVKPKIKIPTPRQTNRARNNLLQKNPLCYEEPPSEMQSEQQQKQVKKGPKASNDQALSTIKEYIQQNLTMINILGDISVNCVRNKAHLKQTKWRVSVFFLYERFYWERVELLKYLKSAELQKLVRKNRLVDQKIKQLWLNSQHRMMLIEQVSKENTNIEQTFQRLSNKTLEECELQPNIQKFISNRDLILAKNKQTVRPFLSQYAAAFIINQFDDLLERGKKNEQEIDYIRKCIFGLQILAQIDGKQQKNKSLQLQQYNKPRNLKQASNTVEHLYDLYYPESEFEGRF